MTFNSICNIGSNCASTNSIIDIYLADLECKNLLKFYSGATVLPSNESEINADNIRFFAGYAGWDAGQLDGELRENAWVVADPHPELAFGSELPEMWEEVLKGMGNEYAELAFYPLDPNLN